AAECDTIVADFVARLDASTWASAPAMLAAAPYAALDWAATTNGMVIVGPRGDTVAAYDAATDRWRTYDPPPFPGVPYILAVRNDAVYVMAAPKDASSATPFAALDLATGVWQSRTPVPRAVPLLRGTGDADHIFGVGAFEDYGQTPSPRTVAVEYD